MDVDYLIFRLNELRRAGKGSLSVKVWIDGSIHRGGAYDVTSVDVGSEDGAEDAWLELSRED